ncbi:MAG: hypothetical protein AB1898_21635 [Acidobacteriota bacterium]
MSIDLDLELTHPISLDDLLSKAGRVLVEMLGLRSIPRLAVEYWEAGRCHASPDVELRERTAGIFTISFVDEPESVQVMAGKRSVSVSMGSPRTNLQYALGAAIAIALAQELGVPIEDDRGFFRSGSQTSAQDLLERLKVTGSWNDCRKAAEQLTGRIDTP